MGQSPLPMQRTAEINPADFNFYERMFAVHGSRAETLGLSNMDRLLPFDPLPGEVAELLGLQPGDYVVDAWNGINSSQGEWFGEILRKISYPFEAAPLTPRSEFMLL